MMVTMMTMMMTDDDDDDDDDSDTLAIVDLKNSFSWFCRFYCLHGGQASARFQLVHFGLMLSDPS